MLNFNLLYNFVTNVFKADYIAFVFTKVQICRHLFCMIKTFKAGLQVFIY